MKHKSILMTDTAILIYLTLIKFLLHILFNGQYGYFRDEFYYMACGEHLAWGYVDHPPFVAMIAALSRWLWGDSLFAIRLLPAIASSIIVFLAGLIAKEMGGGRFAQVTAAIAIIIAPVYLVIGNFLSMNPFDQLFWTAAIYVFIRLINTNNTKLWLVIGLILGIGLQNKHSVVFLGFGLLMALVLTPYRHHFRNKWLWSGILLALICFLPNLIWQIQHDFPTLEFARNASQYKNYAYTPLEFVIGHSLEAHPFNFILILIGLYSLFFVNKKFCVLGWVYLVIFLIFMFTRAKTYYLAPLYPLMVAAGAIMVETWSKKRLQWFKPVTIGLLIMGGIITMPYALPILPVETFIKYSRKLGLTPPPSENSTTGLLPQHYADMFGWQNMTSTVANVYNTLTPEEKRYCKIFTQNYGEAGAIEFWGDSYQLPAVVCGHNNYWLWGPGDEPIQTIIAVGGDRDDYKEFFHEVRQEAVIVSQYAMPYETNIPVFICRRPKVSIQEIWTKVKFYI